MDTLITFDSCNALVGVDLMMCCEKGVEKVKSGHKQCLVPAKGIVFW